MATLDLFEKLHISQMAQSLDLHPFEVARLLGQDGNYGEGMNLEADWAYNILSQVGNYGESFDRNVGMGSPLEIERGINALWTQGGIQYAPPIR